MDLSFGFGIYGSFVALYTFIGFLAGEALFLTYGILAIIPAGPFEHQNLPLGIILIVLASLGIAGLAGMIAGLISGIIMFSPVYWCERRWD